MEVENPALIYANQTRLLPLEEHYLCVLGAALARAVGTLESCALAKPLERLCCNHMPAGHHHWWVLVSTLLFRNRTYKYRMEEV
jgi:hypothetical protein